MDVESYPDLPASLKRDAANKAEFMYMVDTVPDTTETPVAPKAPAKAKGKAAAKVVAKAPAKAKAAPKATAKAAKAPDKAKATPAKASATKKDQYGFRDGSTKSKAVAMYARKSGATLAEVKDKLGSVQLNVLNALEDEGYEVERKAEKRDGARAVTRYFLKGKK